MSDSSEDRDERQLPASERKLQKAREDGQVPRSREAAHAAALMAACLTMALYGPVFAQRTLDLVRSALRFDREAARGMRLNLCSGTAVRFEPGQSRTVELVELGGAREAWGFRGLVQGKL